MKKVVELSLNIVIHLKVDGDGTSSALEYVGRWCWAEGPSIKDVGNSEGGEVKFHWHLPRGRSKKLPTWGRGVSKNLENISLMDNMEDDDVEERTWGDHWQTRAQSSTGDYCSDPSTRCLLHTGWTVLQWNNLLKFFITLSYI